MSLWPREGAERLTVPTLSPEGRGRYQTWPLLLGFWLGFGGFGGPFWVLVRWIVFSRIRRSDRCQSGLLVS